LQKSGGSRNFLLLLLMPPSRTRPPDDVRQLMELLKSRFHLHPQRHAGINWADVEARLQASPQKLDALFAMEQTGGEPDVVTYDKSGDAYLFMDCAPESPAGRRSVCYDRAALESRKEHAPETSATDMAARMGVELLSEADYRLLQSIGPFDTKTSSWIKTPPAIRALGGALFGDFRYGQVFIYHNGAQSYYAARGFRALLRV
jgi:hypothetical protein